MYKLNGLVVIFPYWYCIFISEYTIFGENYCAGAYTPIVPTKFTILCSVCVSFRAVTTGLLLVKYLFRPENLSVSFNIIVNILSCC